jgi:FlaA1/EpsC-like NDP-sugar epimerase
MFRLDPKQTILDHVARKSAGQGELSAEAKAIAQAPIEPSYSAAVIIGIAQVIEGLLLATLGFAIFASYVEPGQQAIYLPTILLVTLLANVLFNAARTHRITAYRTALQQTARVLGSWTVVFVVLMTIVFFFKSAEFVSRVWLMSWFISGALVLVVFRLSLRQIILQWTSEGRLKRRTVIVGGGHDAEVLVDSILKSAASDVRMLGVFDDRNDERSPESVASLPKLGRVADLLEFARQTRVDLVIVSMPLSAEKRVLEMLTQLWVLPVDIRLSAHMSKLRFTSKAYSYVGDVPVFDMADRPISDWNLVFKWLFDKSVALLALLLL